MSTAPVNDFPRTSPGHYGQPPPGPGRPWSAGRVLALVIGLLLALFSMGALVTGLVGIVIDQTQRDPDGFIETASVEFESNGYAIVATGLEVDTAVPGWLQLRSVFGDIRLTAEGTDGEPIFVGVAHEEDVAGYLAGMGYDQVIEIRHGNVTYVPHTGEAPESRPADQDIWAAWTEGSGEQSLTVDLETGRWVAVAMNADASADVQVAASAAADLPALPWVAVVLIAAGGTGLLLGAIVIYLAARERRPTTA